MVNPCRDWAHIPHTGEREWTVLRCYNSVFRTSVRVEDKLLWQVLSFFAQGPRVTQCAFSIGSSPLCLLGVWINLLVTHLENKEKDSSLSNMAWVTAFTPFSFTLDTPPLLLSEALVLAIVPDVGTRLELKGHNKSARGGTGKVRTTR